VPITKSTYLLTY